MNGNTTKPVELVIVSGKGGTGKTTVSASLAVLAGNAVVADCDVDASNMELLLAPTLVEKKPFIGGQQAGISSSLCVGCGRCARNCRFDAIHPISAQGRTKFKVDPAACEGCAVCVEVCPRNAIMMHPVEGGELFVSDTACGPLVHARLRPGGGNSGKLATLVRQTARKQSETAERQLIIVDGPPGVGCPTIASLTGAAYVIAVTEPTPSGEHDLQRIVELCAHFRQKVRVCINKADINPVVAKRIRDKVRELGAETIGEIPYDPNILLCTRNGVPIVKQIPDAPAAKAIRALWQNLLPLIQD